MQSSFILTPEQVTARLKSADLTQVRVQTLGSWCLLHSLYHTMIISSWRTLLCDQKTHHMCRMGLLYVLHEIAYKTSTKGSGASLFLDDMTVEAPLAIDAMCNSVVKNKTELREIKERLTQLMECWTEMRIFPQAVLAGITRILSALVVPC